MFYGYEEYLSEPSEADKIIEEMKDKLHDLITDEAKNMMDKYREAIEKTDKLDSDILRKRNRIKTLQREIEELEEKYEHIDKYKMPRKYVDSFVREYTGYFAPGDKVFITDSRSKRIECDKCKGKKKIKANIDGEEITIKCIKCNGYGTVTDTTKVIEERIIDSVRLKLCFSKDGVRLWSSDCVYVKGMEYAINPKYIYKSYEDAEKSLKEIK